MLNPEAPEYIPMVSYPYPSNHPYSIFSLQPPHLLLPTLPPIEMLYPSFYSNLFLYLSPPLTDTIIKTQTQVFNPSPHQNLLLPTTTTISSSSSSFTPLSQQEAENQKKPLQTLMGSPSNQLQSRYGVTESRVRERSAAKKVWCMKPKIPAPNPVSCDLGFKEVGEAKFGDNKTTLMIRNIPNKYSRGKLLELLDKICCLKNDKLELGSSEGEKQDISAFDFVYLPMDFKNKCNIGYAFVNLTNASGARNLYEYLHDYEWKDFYSKKICQICYARVQGKHALIEHFKRSTFRCDSDEYLPLSFEPYRTGSNSPVTMLVGTRTSLPVSMKHRE